MKPEALARYCQFIIEASLMLVIFLVPWHVDTRLSGVMLGKLAMMQVFTLTCLVGLLLKAIVTKKVIIHHTPFDLPLCLFLITAILSTVFSVCPYLSFWGAYYRYEGLLTFINYLLLFYITANWLDRKAILRILGTAILSGAVVSLYGLLQHLHIDLVGWREYGTGRVISTFGNAVYFGAYVATVFPLALAGYLLAGRRQQAAGRKQEAVSSRQPAGGSRQKTVGSKQSTVAGNRGFSRLLPAAYSLLSAASCLLILSGIFVSNTRGAFLGFAASCVLFGILVRKRLEQSMKSGLILLLAGIACVSLYFILNPELSPLKRFAQTFSTQTENKAGQESPKIVGGAASRLFMWRDSLGIIKDYPLLGTGPETFGMVYSRYRSLDLIRNEGGEYGRPDRVHNDIIDLAITKGLLGILAYLWFLFVFVRVCLRVAAECRNEAILAIAILSGGLGYFVQNQFCFWILPSTSIFFIMAGCIARLVPSRQAYNVRVAAIACIAALIIGLAFCVVKTTIPWYRADLEYKKGAELYWSGQKEASIDRFKAALSLNPKEKLYSEYIIHACLDTVDKMPGNIDPAIAEAQRINKAYPLESNFYNLLGMSYERKGQLDEARASYEKMLVIDPLFGEARDKIAGIYLRQNRFNEAVTVLKDGLKIIPDYVPFLSKLGVICLNQRQDGLAEKYLKDVVRLSPDNLDAHTNLARIYYERKKIDLVIIECQEMVRINPDDVDTHRNLGSLYYQKQQYPQAQAEFLKVLSLKPDDEYSQRLLGRINYSAANKQ